MGELLRNDRFLETKNVKLIVHSPLRRARKTCHGVLGTVAVEVTADVGSVYKCENEHRVVQLEDLKERTPQEWLPFSKESYYNRILSVVNWLAQQEEDVIVIVGHSQFFKTMLGLDYKFGNCDVWEVELAVKKDDGVGNQSTHNWRNLRQLYSL